MTPPRGRRRESPGTTLGRDARRRQSAFRLATRETFTADSLFSPPLFFGGLAFPGALLGTSTEDVALVESPGYRGATEAFAAFGLRVRAAAVDAGGIVLPGGPAPRIVYVTPCFRSPSEVPLTASRRDALLELSEESGTLVFEDGV